MLQSSAYSHSILARRRHVHIYCIHCGWSYEGAPYNNVSGSTDFQAPHPAITKRLSTNVPFKDHKRRTALALWAAEGHVRMHKLLYLVSYG